MAKRISLTDEAYDEALRRVVESSENDPGLMIRCSRTGADVVRDPSGKPVWQEVEPSDWQALVVPLKYLSASEENVAQVGRLRVYLRGYQQGQGSVMVSLASGEFLVQIS